MTFWSLCFCGPVPTHSPPCSHCLWYSPLPPSRCTSTHSSHPNYTQFGSYRISSPHKYGSVVLYLISQSFLNSTFLSLFCSSFPVNCWISCWFVIPHWGRTAWGWTGNPDWWWMPKSHPICIRLSLSWGYCCCKECCLLLFGKYSGF